jgi:hypothetical protein
MLEAEHRESAESVEMSSASGSMQDVIELSEESASEHDEDEVDVQLSAEDSDEDSEDFVFSDEDSVVDRRPAAGRRQTLKQEQGQAQEDDGDDWSGISSLAEEMEMGDAGVRPQATAVAPTTVSAAAPARKKAPIKRNTKMGATAAAPVAGAPSARASRKALLPSVAATKAPRATVRAENASVPVAVAPEMRRRAPVVKQAPAKSSAFENK